MTPQPPDPDDLEAFCKWILNECEPAVIGWLRLLGVDDHTIHDVFQEALYRAVRSRATYKPHLPLWPWFKRIVDNALWDIRRQSGALIFRTNADDQLDEIPDPGGGPYEQDEELPPAILHALVSCLNSLSAIDQILLDVEMGRLSYEDAAKLIARVSNRSITDKSLRTAKHRAMKRLIACLKGSGLGGNDGTDRR